MRKLLTVCLILTLCVSSAAAETSILSQDEIDFWHEQLEVLTDEIGTRTVWDPEIELARDALIAVFERYGYNQNDGSLYYDPTGGNVGDAVKFAVIGSTSHPTTLDAGDFHLIA